MCGKLYSVLEDQLRMVVRNVQKCVAKSKQFKKCHRNTQIYIFCWQVILCIWVIAYSDGSLHRQRSAQNRIAVFHGKWKVSDEEHCSSCNQCKFWENRNATWAVFPSQKPAPANLYDFHGKLWPLASVNMIYVIIYSDNNEERARMRLEIRTFWCLCQDFGVGDAHTKDIECQCSSGCM